MAELIKPCPFCGSEAKLVETSRRITKEYLIRCTNIDCTLRPKTPSFVDKDEAICRWNNRPNEFNVQKYEKLIKEDMAKVHIENQQLIAELRRTYSDVTEEEIREKAIDEFAEKLKLEFENSVGVPRLAAIYATNVINRVVEKLTEGNGYE